MKIYHGIIQDYLPSIQSNGLTSNSYFGTFEEASRYTDCSQIFELDSDLYNIIPNHTLIDYYKNNDPDNEAYQSWLKSKQLWIDSLHLFGSVIVEDSICYSELIIKNI